MCGILGVVSSSRLDQGSIAAVTAQQRLIANRGPDDSDYLASDHYCIAHTRLSIQDLSSSGRQPMLSHCGRYAIVYNGEIYNWQPLKKHFLSSVNLSSNSDTEVLLELLAREGPQNVLSLLDGMYAFALVDTKEKKMFLARDFFGQKPLYYWSSENIFAFSSSATAVKNISEYFGFVPEVNERMIGTYLDIGFTTQPDSVWHNICQIGRNTVVEINFSGTKLSVSSVEINHDNGALENCEYSCLEKAIDASVAQCLVADVPVGLFLSGGIDSSLIAAIARRYGPLKSFSIGFESTAYDESPLAERVANRLGTEHQTITLDESTIEAIATKLPGIFDEPFGDPSIIPTVYLSEVASNEVTVALTGDGGDELFYGYNRHVYAKIAEKTPRISGLLAKTASAARLARVIDPLGNALGIKTASEKLEKISRIHGALQDRNYLGVIGNGGIRHLAINPRSPPPNGLPEFVREQDINVYQQSGTLVKSDRCSMAAGLELRAPLLQAPVLGYAKKYISANSEIRYLSGKTSLRHLAYHLVGEDLLSRPKAGFTPPISSWLSGPLESWVRDGLAKLKDSSLGHRVHRIPDRIEPHAMAAMLWRQAILGHWLDHNNL